MIEKEGGERGGIERREKKKNREKMKGSEIVKE